MLINLIDYVVVVVFAAFVFVCVGFCFRGVD